ncbi:CPBP family intramembrane glutamic endopeptidase [Alicyclobacillus pomorum]|jgi:Type II CAAX prenyl endopeptidase Rce1-like|uniref:CPBP family intramembrane glutamic endopeptidase n=1 Tax=Alicyclobacillus pomorum TaxID=204470 RepID=UPI000426F4A6|nr:CPBP family intramembrane glutamic endopeptidase [Alicyclobacillus pomorum]
MKLWRDMPQRLVENLPIWRIVFIVFLAFDIAISSILPDSVQSSNPAPAVMLFAVFVASLFLLTCDFMRRISSGHNQLQPVSPLPSSVARWKVALYRVCLPFTRYIAFFIVWLALSGGFSALIDQLLPSFSSDQNIGFSDVNIWGAAGIAFLGCLEEYWRWSMIITVLLLVKWIFRRQWERSRKLRNAGFVLAILISSLVFGMAHYQEFSHYKSLSYIVLGTMGLLLALAAIITRRFLVAVALHYVYDLLAISNGFDFLQIYLLVIAAILAIVVFPTFGLLLRSVRPALRGWQMAIPNTHEHQ